MDLVRYHFPFPALERDPHAPRVLVTLATWGILRDRLPRNFYLSVDDCVRALEARLADWLQAIAPIRYQ